MASITRLLWLLLLVGVATAVCPTKEDIENMYPIDPEQARLALKPMPNCRTVECIEASMKIVGAKLHVATQENERDKARQSISLCQRLEIESEL